MLFRIEEQNNDRKVFAEHTIAQGVELCVCSGPIIDYKDTLRLSDRESFALQVEKELYIYLDPPARYFNHCCEPNCGVSPDLKLLTIKQVFKNEELRWDYSTTMLEHHWTMKCNCNKTTCRKVIGDFDKLPKLLQDKYIAMNIVQKFIITDISKRG